MDPRPRVPPPTFARQEADAPRLPAAGAGAPGGAPLQRSPLAAAPRELLDELSAAVERVTMMQFATDRRAHFEAVVTARAVAAGAPDVAAYARRVLANPAGIDMNALVDELTIKETT